jgi:hypothetical protein
MDQVRNALAEFSTQDGTYQIPVDTFRSILNEHVPKQKPKRPQSAFLLWKSKEKDYINSQVTETGRGKIASKAGEIWNSMSDDEKKPYVDDVTKLMDQYMEAMKLYKEEVVVSRPTKNAGRPRLTDEEKQLRKEERQKKKKTTSETVRSVEVEDTESETEEVNVDDFQYNGTDYLIDLNSGDIYNPETEVVVGKKVGEIVTIF